MSKKNKVPVSREASSAPRPAAFSPWTGLGGLREEIERLFDSFEPASRARGLTLRPAIDMTENGKAYTVSAELPGLEPEKVAVKISSGMLTIAGEKSEEEEHDKDDYHVSERRWGSFHRSLRVPDNVDQDKIEAQFSKGVLTITLPKSEAALAAEKTIAIKAA